MGKGEVERGEEEKGGEKGKKHIYKPNGTVSKQRKINQKSYK